MCQGGVDGLEDDLLFIGGWLSSLSDFCFKVGVVNICILCPVFFQAFYILLIENWEKILVWHFEEDCPLSGYISGSELQILDHLLITKEIISFENFILMIAVVDSSNFPSTMGHGPLVVLPDKNMVLLLKGTFIEQAEYFFFTTCFLNNLSFEVALKFHAVIKLFGFFIFDMELWEEGTSHHISNFISLFSLYLFFDDGIDILPDGSVKCEEDGFLFAADGWMFQT